MSLNKKRHNKKRNTAFLYEILVREITKCALSGEATRQKKVLQLCKEAFHRNSLLFREKELYRAILETNDLNKETAVKLLEAVKAERSKIDDKKLFAEQSSLIFKINKELNGTPFQIFVPGYKNLASISQIFNNSVKIKEKVLLENEMVEKMCSSEELKEQENLKSIDSLTYKTFIKKFNESYGDSLLSEQKEMITKYIMSFVDNGLDLKLYLNEEIGRLKNKLHEVVNIKDVSNDEYMQQKIAAVQLFLENIKNSEIGDGAVEKLLKIQQLVNEALEN